MTIGRRSKFFSEHARATAVPSWFATSWMPSIACAMAALLTACTGARSALSLSVDAGDRDAGLALERPPFCVPSWSEARRLEAGPSVPVALATGPHGFWLVRNGAYLGEVRPVVVALDPEGRELGRSVLDSPDPLPDFSGHVWELSDRALAVAPTPTSIVVIFMGCGGYICGSDFSTSGPQTLFAQAFDGRAAPMAPLHRLISLGLADWEPERLRVAWAGDRVVLMAHMPFSMSEIELDALGRPIGDLTFYDSAGVPTVEPHVTEFYHPELLPGGREFRIIDTIRDDVGAIAHDTVVAFSYRAGDRSHARVSTIGHGDFMRVLAVSRRPALSGAFVVWSARDSPAVLTTLDGDGRVSTEVGIEGLYGVGAIGAHAALARVWVNPREIERFDERLYEFQILDPQTGTVVDRRSDAFSRSVMVAGDDRAAIVGVNSAGELVFQTVGCALTGRAE